MKRIFVRGHRHVLGFVVAAQLALGVVAGARPASAATLNDTLESRARSIVGAMRGYVVMPAGSPSCPAPTSCGGDGSNHHGVTYPWNCGFFAAGTVCTSAGLPTSTAHRGSDFVHESMHLYLYRLEQKGLLAWYRLGYPTKNITWGNEGFTDCLAAIHGATTLHYGCPSDLLPIANKLRNEWSPYNSPKWY